MSDITVKITYLNWKTAEMKQFTITAPYDEIWYHENNGWEIVDTGVPYANQIWINVRNQTGYEVEDSFSLDGIETIKGDVE